MAVLITHRHSLTDACYDRELALIPDDIRGWLADSQPTDAKVGRPGDTDDQREAAARDIEQRLAATPNNDPLKNGGAIRVLHHDFSIVPEQGSR